MSVSTQQASLCCPENSDYTCHFPQISWQQSIEDNSLLKQTQNMTVARLSNNSHIHICVVSAEKFAPKCMRDCFIQSQRLSALMADELGVCA